MPDIVHLQVVVSVEYYAWLIKQAQRQNVSFTEVISAMLNEYRSQDRSVPIIKKPVGRYERPPKEDDSGDNRDYGDEDQSLPRPEDWREKMRSMETKQPEHLGTDYESTEADDAMYLGKEKEKGR